jgi:DMSO reductase family type II enzyme molybdopterin subunit
MESSELVTARPHTTRRSSSVKAPTRPHPSSKRSTRAVSPAPERAGEDAYRDQWKWDRVGWGTHGMGCYPGNCPYRVYVKDGRVLFEEQAGTFPIIEAGVPDMNPTGCQKGCAWGEFLYGQERLLHPLKRVGRRGGGKWQRITWDQALTEIADAIIAAIRELGPESILSPGPSSANRPNRGRREILGELGALETDISGEVNDDFLGIYLTFGKIFAVSSMDDWFQPELHFIWHLNPFYTRIPYAHYITEARYKGTEVISIAPDVNPSAIHSDRFVPVKPGSDAALALAMCKVILDERIFDNSFISEQTDLPLLVRSDNRRFLRGDDMADGGLDDRFFFWDLSTNGIAPAPRGTLALADVLPALEGSFPVVLADGSRVRVTPVLELLRRKLDDYTPEKASELCGVSPEVIRELARKVATKSTLFNTGFNVSKYYHGDLMERSMCLLLALTGNWGKKGTGIRTWGVPGGSGAVISTAKTGPGEEQSLRLMEMLKALSDTMRARDPDITDEIAMLDLASPGRKLAQASDLVLASGGAVGRIVPTFFMWYHHFGFRDAWNTPEWGDPTMARTFDEYAREAMEKGWWRGVERPGKQQPPRVWLEFSNTLRRSRGGQRIYLDKLWPQLKLIVTFDHRMSGTAYFSDIVLPVAGQHEKQKGVLCLDPGWFVLDDKVVDPPSDEIKDEWQALLALAKKLEQRAGKLGLEVYEDSFGQQFRLDGLHDRMSAQGAFVDSDAWADDAIRDCALVGELPEGTTLESMRKGGPVRIRKSGIDPISLAMAAEIKPDETFTCWTDHIEKKRPYPTLTRRAQFYIDHDWFLEAGEELPVHKEPPKMGGDYPFMITSGHTRWSNWSVNIASKMMLNTHRGRPHMVMSSEDAARKGINDNEEVRLHNDYGATSVPVKLSPSVRPGQVIIYNGWDLFQFKDWKGPNELEPGMVKWLHLAGGYGHLRYYFGNWTPVHSDRATRVEVSKIR